MGQAVQALAMHGATLILLPPRFILHKEEYRDEENEGEIFDLILYDNNEMTTNETTTMK